MIAYCFRDGHVHLTPDGAPEGAVELFRGPQRDVHRLIEQTTDSRQITQLVDNTTMEEDQNALIDYLREADYRSSRFVTVADLSPEILAADQEA